MPSQLIREQFLAERGKFIKGGVEVPAPKF